MSAKLVPSVSFAVGGVVATALFFLLPGGGLGQGIVFVSLSAAASVSLIVRVATGALTGWMWRVLAVSQSVYVVATAGWYFAPFAMDRALPYPSMVDVGYLTAYGGWVVFLIGVSHARSSTNRGVAWEATAAALALSVLAWIVLLGDAIDTAGSPALARATSAAYPVLLLALTALGAGLAVGRARASVVDGLLFAWLGIELLADTWFSVAVLDGSFRFGHPWFGAWMVAYSAFGALVLHPEAEHLTSERDSPWRPRARSSAIVIIPIIVGAVVALAWHAGDEHRVEIMTLAVAISLAITIIAVRLAFTSRDLSIERRMRDQLTRAHTELEHIATHDALTGLADRGAFDARLAAALARRRPPGRCACLLVVDLDSFKAVNDSFGHSAGDALLKLAAARLNEVVRPEDGVARLGGDEFAVVVDDGDVRTSLVLAERVVTALREPADLGTAVVAPKVSVGVHAALAGETPEEVMVRADTALYAAKAAGGDGYELFDAARHRHFLDRYQLELDLRVAVGRDELVLYYQPIIDLVTRRVVNAEALVRWNHPTRGFLQPGQFMEVAETSGAIVEVGRAVLRQACRDAGAWQALPGGAGVGVAVNMSRKELQRAAVVDGIREVLDEAGIDPALTTLEVTETALMADTDEMVARLDKIKAIGVNLAMDDFGTGYSSLSHLRALPIDVLKIDKAFVDGIAREDEEWALAAAIIRLAVSLGKRTLAEGIERAAQLAHLRALGCELGQGWLFARAMPLEEFIAFLDEHDLERINPSG